MKKMRTRKYRCKRNKEDFTEMVRYPDGNLAIAATNDSAEVYSWNLHDYRQVKAMQEFLRKTEPKKKLKNLEYVGTEEADIHIFKEKVKK